MADKKRSQEFRLKERGHIRNYFIKEMKQNELKSKKEKNICKI